MLELNDLAETTIPLAPIPRLALNARDAAAALGVSERTWRSWVSAGVAPPPTISIGRVYRWSVDDLQTWLAKQSRGTAR